MFHINQMANRHDVYIQEAIAEAKKATMRFQHGCVIVHNERIISRGHNRGVKTHNMYSVHAEIAAIENMTRNRIKLEATTMYVVRINSKDMNKDDIHTRTMNSRPCDNCMKCIEHHKIKKCYFTHLNI